MHFKDLFENTLRQVDRWNNEHRFWDLEMPFLALIHLDNAIDRLKKLLNRGQDWFWEEEFLSQLEKLKKYIEDHDIKNLRNDLVHREKIYKHQDRKGEELPLEFVLILGGYNHTNGIYEFGPNYRINLPELFSTVETTRNEIAKICKNRLISYYSHKKRFQDRLIPFTALQTLAKLSTDESICYQ